MSRRPPHDPNLQDIIEYLRRDADNYARFDERLEILETSIRKLERVVLDGTGDQIALVQQVLENRFILNTLRENVSNNAARIAESKKQIEDSQRLRTQTLTAIILALISAAASMVSAYISVNRQ